MASECARVRFEDREVMPLVSVLMAVYNGEDYLESCMDSLLGQTFRDFELLVLDDGSSDDTLKILRGYQKVDGRLAVISRENRGLVSSLNELIAMAKGTYLARMDADDVALPQRFEKQVDFLRRNPEIAAVGTAFIMIDSRGRKIGPIKSPTDHETIERHLLEGHCVLSHPSIMVRADAMAQAGGYREEFPAAQDLDLWLRMSEFARLANLPDILLEYRLHSKSISEASGSIQRECKVRATSEALKRRGIDRAIVIQDHWRPDGSVPSQLDFALRYGWIAWRFNNKGAWWSFTLQALRLAPFSISSWKLAFFGLVKRSPERIGKTQ